MRKPTNDDIFRESLKNLKKTIGFGVSILNKETKETKPLEKSDSGSILKYIEINEQT